MTVAVALTPMTCCACGTAFGMAESVYRDRRRTLETFYCPNGHAQSFKQSEADRLAAELKRAQLLAASLKEDADRARTDRGHIERQLIAARGQITKLRNRLGT